MPNLAPADWLIVLIFFFFAISAGFSLKAAIGVSKDYLQGGRALPAWLCGLALAAAGLGLQAPVTFGAMGAHYGFESVPFALMGGIPAMLFVGIFMMPQYYGSNARTVPDYLGKRFDKKTRILSAVLFLVSTLTGIAFSLHAMARIFAALRLFDEPLRALKLNAEASSLVAMAIPAALVLAYVLLGGLPGAIYNQAMQLFVMAAGFLPVVFLGLKQLGGWNGLKSASATAGSTYFHLASGGHNGPAAFAFAAGIGLLFGMGFWCADFRVLQIAMAAKGTKSAQQVPIIAAVVWLVLPLALILPGVMALGMPTPHTTISVHSDNVAIYHDITVVPPADEAGQGLVPAVIDQASGKPKQRADGHNRLEYALAAPNMLLHFLPMGLLGLGISALLACMMSGIAAGMSAFNAVFTFDIYQAHIRKTAEERHLMLVSRWAAGTAMLAAYGVAWAVLHWHLRLDRMVGVLAWFSAPLLVIILLGMFCKRTTGHGAFAGLVAGVVCTTIVSHHHLNRLGHGLLAVVCGVGASLLIGIAVSLFTKPRSDKDLADTVYSLRKRKVVKTVWWKRIEAMAGAILIAGIAMTLIFA